MKFAANIEMWYTHLPFLDRVGAAAKAGFKAIEFWEYQGKDLKGLLEQTQRHGLTITQFTAWGWDRWMNDPRNETAIEEQIVEACKIGKLLNCSMGTVVAGDDQPGMTQEEMHQQIIKVLKKLVPILEKEEFMVILEPMNIRVDHAGHCLYGSEPGIKICQAVNSPWVKLNWDLYHMQISEGDLCGHMKSGFPHIGYIQLADHPGRNEPGTGEINYQRVLNEAIKLGYRGYFGLECRPLENEEKALARLQRIQLPVHH